MAPKTVAQTVFQMAEKKGVALVVASAAVTVDTMGGRMDKMRVLQMGARKAAALVVASAVEKVGLMVDAMAD